MTELETTSYRVTIPGGIAGANLAGIVDRPKAWADNSEGATRPVAVFSHCFTCNKDLKATVRISRALAKSGIAVLRFDMSGLGGSEGDFSQSNFTTNLSDLAASIRFASSELGPVTSLIGHSFGGIASLVTAALSTDLTSTLHLQDLSFVATLASPSDTNHLATLLARMNPAIDAVGQGAVTIGGVSWTIRRQMLEDFRTHDVTSVIPKVQCPVLLLHSPVDQTVSIDHAIRLMSLIQTDRTSSGTEITPVSLVSLPGADHLLANNPSDLQFVSEMLASWSRRFT